ncbi:MAG: TetR/AcrR family transcriptional regulator [Burkholderiales bacterium]
MPPRPAAAARPEPARESRRTILDTAARLFREQGYAATSMRDIAGACGIKAGSLYYHFAAKDDIVGEVLEEGVQKTFDRVREAVGALPADAPADVVLRTAVRAHLHAMFRMSDYTIANLRIFGQVPESLRAAHGTLRDAYERYWAGLLGRCARRGDLDPARDLRLARLFLIGAMNGTLDWYHAGRLSIEAVADELAAVFLQGLAPRPATRAAPRRRPAARAAGAPPRGPAK